MKKIAMALSVAMVLGSAVYAGKDVTVAESKVVPVLSPWYVGIGYSNLKMEVDCVTREYYWDGTLLNTDRYSDDDRANGVLFLGGYEFNDYLAIEGRWTVALEDFKFKDNTEISYYNIALYIKPHFDVGDFSIYGLLGYGYSHFDDDNDIDGGDSDFQYGAGLSYKITENLSIFADYTVLYNKDNSDPFHLSSSTPGVGSETTNCDVKVDSINVGFTYRF